MTDRDPRIGEVVLGRWQIDALLGSGGMSSVYGAVHRSNGRRVAIKVMHPHLMGIADVVERFLREGYAANRVNHPGAVSVLDDGALADGTPCLVMEHLAGGSLDRWMSEHGPMPLRETLLVVDRLLDVLAASHRAQVIHRDVKPENIFLTERGEVKLLDFGIARSVEISSGTLTGATMGTPSYMPPEQAAGRWNEVDGRADIFAAGAVALALLGGAPPRNGETANLILLMAMSVPLETVKERRLDVPEVIANVIDRAVAWSANDRYSSAEALSAALRAAWLAARGQPLDGHADHLTAMGRVLASRRTEPDHSRTTPLAMPPNGASLLAAATPLTNTVHRPRLLRNRLLATLATTVILAAGLGVGVTRWIVPRSPRAVATTPAWPVVTPSASVSASAPSPAPEPSAPRVAAADASIVSEAPAPAAAPTAKKVPPPPPPSAKPHPKKPPVAPLPPPASDDMLTRRR